MPTLDEYLSILIESGGSDLHLAASTVPGLRVQGSLHVLGSDLVDASAMEAYTRQVLGDERFGLLDYAKNFDFIHEARIHDEPRRFRGNVFVQRDGLNMVLRAIPTKIPTLGDLGLPPAVRVLAELHQGLVLVTGASGSGKTSTIAALMDHINQRQRLHIITIEDPIEYIHQNRLALINHRQLGKHFDSFATALRGALREDPDVIVIGELRDLETTQLAIRAAETGHLVLTTMHTTSAAKTVDRLVDNFPAEQQEQIRAMLAESLKGVIAQQLVPRADGHGRVLAVELLIVTPPIANLIKDGKTFHVTNAMQTGRGQGMCLMDHTLAALCRDGWISPEEAQSRMLDKAVLFQTR